MRDFFLFCLDLEYLQKLKRPNFYTLVFYTFAKRAQNFTKII